jgi:hypothetical protein
MNLFVEPKHDEICWRSRNGQYYLVKDKDSVRPTWTVALVVVIAAIVTCAIIFDVGALALLVAVGFLTWFFGEVEGFRFSRYLFERRLESLYICDTYFAPQIRYWDHPTVQAALEDMWDEKVLMKDQFDVNEWTNPFAHIGYALDEQTEIEKKRLLATRERIDYAKGIKEANEILNKSLE